MQFSDVSTISTSCLGFSNTATWACVVCYTSFHSKQTMETDTVLEHCLLK